MYLKSLELTGFKSFARKSSLEFTSPITSIVGPNGSGKSNIAESFRFVLGEQSIKSLRGKRTEDLIFNGSKDMGRLNRASVKVVFDNSARFLNVDFDEVTLERIVHRDSQSEYFINGSPVRLKDIIELLASAHIGSSGHHIISQGEADKILNASIKERREMFEDALGLKIYEYKREESEKKLFKTEENIKQVESLRREIAPHIKFLKKQVEKLERARAMKDDLIVFYKEYFKRETIYLSNQKENLKNKIEKPREELQGLNKELQELREKLSKLEDKSGRNKVLLSLEREMQEIRSKKDTLSREIGRIEGAISYEERQLNRANERASSNNNKLIPLSDVEEFEKEIVELSNKANQESDLGLIKSIFQDLLKRFHQFIEYRREKVDEESKKISQDEINKLKEKKGYTEVELKTVADRENSLNQEYMKVKTDIEAEKDSGMEVQKKIFEIMTRQNELHGFISLTSTEEDRVRVEEEEFKQELREAMILAGREAVSYENFEVPTDVLNEERRMQVERRRNIEKIKIRLEEIGGGSSDDILKEYNEAEERDAFLAREIDDLNRSAMSLKQLIDELKQKLNEEFQSGILKINIEFQKYFNLMFGGGEASVVVVREKKKKRSQGEGLEEEGESYLSQMTEEEEIEEGIDIHINLPRKKIKGLMMLSGGERALTSIALLFAMSQVNPPPFIILDETDAALDEANSRKYGDMVENLSKHSQLILITHNRETMSRAGVIYGVTMAGDGVSKLLSISFDDAAAVAK
ncbi:MAG: AAA family ATPase [Candidatus Paceibacterota bacterium]